MSYPRYKFVVFYRQRGNPRAPMHSLQLTTTCKEAARVLADRWWSSKGLDGQYVVLQVKKIGPASKEVE